MKEISNLLVILFILLLIASCKENNNENEKFYYKDYQPNIEVLSYDSAYIDLDDDDKDDIKANVNTSAIIITSNSNIQIYCGTQNSASLTPVKENDVIDNSMVWTNTTHGLLGLLGSEYETYIAFKFSKENNGYYGWIKIIFNDSTLYIDKYAYNKIASEPILAGQLLSY